MSCERESSLRFWSSLNSNDSIGCARAAVSEKWETAEGKVPRQYNHLAFFFVVVVFVWFFTLASVESVELSISACVAEKFWFCRLSLNHKVLHYGDLDESPQGEVPFEMLSDKSKGLFFFFTESLLSEGPITKCNMLHCRQNVRERFLWTRRLHSSEWELIWGQAAFLNTSVLTKIVKYLHFISLN